MTKKAMEALIEELKQTIKTQADTIRVLLTLMPPVYMPLASLPAQPTIVPSPVWPPFTPFVGDPPNHPWGTPNWSGTIGGNVQSQERKVLCINSTNDLCGAMGGITEGD